MLPDEPTQEERLEEVDNDSGTTPFQAPDDVSADAAVDDTHPLTDSEADPTEIYGSGIASASNYPDGHAEVLGYDPSKDQRRQDDSGAQ